MITFEPKVSKGDRSQMLFARVPPEVAREVRRVAEEHGTTYSEVVRVFIRDGLQRLERQSRRQDAGRSQGLK